MDYYYTQLIGNPNNMPVLKATAGFSGFALIDADPYYTSNLNWGSTNVFFRQVRNFVFDLTSVPPTIAQNGIHWPTAQATSIENVVFQMSSAANTQHVGIFCESGEFRFSLLCYLFLHLPPFPVPSRLQVSRGEASRHLVDRTFLAGLTSFEQAPRVG